MKLVLLSIEEQQHLYGQVQHDRLINKMAIFNILFLFIITKDIN